MIKTRTRVLWEERIEERTDVRRDKEEFKMHKQSIVVAGEEEE